jgi:UDP-glucose 4-epimerase
MPESDSADNTYRGRDVAVTGASGFIGTAIRRRLAAEGAIVHAVSRGGRADDAADEWWELDLRLSGALDGLLSTVAPDVVFHLAGETSAGRELELVEPTFSANVVSSVNLLASVARLSPKTRVVSAGSLEEPAPGAAATSPYALSKATSSAYSHLFHELYGTRAVVLRVFMVYGPGQAAVSKLVPYVILALLDGEPALLTSGERGVDWIYVDDVAAAFLAAGTAGGEADGGTFDIGSGSLVPIRTVAEEIRGLVGGGELRFGARVERKDELVRVADPESAAAILGFRATTSLSDGLRATVAWYRDVYRAGSSASLRA